MKILYSKMLKDLLEKKQISIHSSVLVVAGGPNDIKTLEHFGFNNLTITNIAIHPGIKPHSLFKYSEADLNDLKFSNSSYDWVMVSAALHHLYSPHKGLCEILRVAKEGVLVIESRDNFLSRLSVKFKLGLEYELDALLTDGTGGVNNSHIPNFIYRWTKREVKKTVNSFLPETINGFHFYQNFEIPYARVKREKNILKKVIFRIALVPLMLLKIFLPSQANEFGFVILKSTNLRPWLVRVEDSVVLNKEYLKKLFKINF